MYLMRSRFKLFTYIVFLQTGKKAQPRRNHYIKDAGWFFFLKRISTLVRDNQSILRILTYIQYIIVRFKLLFYPIGKHFDNISKRAYNQNHTLLRRSNIVPLLRRFIICNAFYSIALLHCQDLRRTRSLNRGCLDNVAIQQLPVLLLSFVVRSASMAVDPFCWW